LTSARAALRCESSHLGLHVGVNDAHIVSGEKRERPQQGFAELAHQRQRKAVKLHLLQQRVPGMPRTSRVAHNQKQERERERVSETAPVAR
jgi:hypothetical protein